MILRAGEVVCAVQSVGTNTRKFIVSSTCSYTV